MGFLSTVPSDANDRMRAAAGDAKDGRFPGERVMLIDAGNLRG